MLTNSFIFLDSIGQRQERRIWEQGILDWNRFIETDSIRGVSSLKKHFMDRKLMKAKEAMARHDAGFFSSIPLSCNWRLWDLFKDDAVFLDIETSGYYGNITIVGLYDGLDTKIMVRGHNLDKELLRRELSQYKLLVTFNGASFDLPVIRRYFGDIIPDIPHIDLRGVCSRAGLKGGLKSIERQIGISRPDELAHVYGDDAAFLWHKYMMTGDEKYLGILIRYNEQDIINLKPLAELAISELWKRTFGRVPITYPAAPSGTGCS